MRCTVLCPAWFSLQTRRLPNPMVPAAVVSQTFSFATVIVTLAHPFLSTLSLLALRQFFFSSIAYNEGCNSRWEGELIIVSHVKNALQYIIVSRSISFYSRGRSFFAWKNFLSNQLHFTPQAKVVREPEEIMCRAGRLNSRPLEN